MYDFAYAKPTSLPDAVKLLGTGDMDAKALAGGQTFIPVLKQRLNKPSTVVDLSKLGLSGIALEGDRLAIGAMTTHRDVALSAVAAKAIPANQLGNNWSKKCGTASWAFGLPSRPITEIFFAIAA